MEVERFEFDFFVSGQEITAHAEKFKAVKYPQIYVWFRINRKAKQFTFYLLPDELFWFEMLVEDEKLGYKVAFHLGKKYNLKIAKRPGLTPS